MPGEDLLRPKSRPGGARRQFQVPRGEIFGFLGPNGAGKTTTVRCMLDLIRPTAGRIALFGLDARRDLLVIHRRLGYLPGDVRLPGDLTGKQFLDRCSRMAGLEPVLLPMLLQRFEVPLERKLKGFSKGMRQMIAIIQACMCNPELLILKAYAMNQLTEGIIVGAAARRLRRGRLNGLVQQTNAPGAYRALTEFATSRLKAGTLLYRAGTSASGLIPKEGLSAGRRVAITVLGVAALVGILLAIVHVYQTPTLPAFPPR